VRAPAQGKAEDVTVYSSDPVEMALHWQNEGGEYLHIVDLDGAFEGRPVHGEVIGRIAKALSAFRLRSAAACAPTRTSSSCSRWARIA
jgi:hypothetical protein